MENSEIIIELIKENLEEIRHNTDHRQGVTQFIFTIGAGIGFAATTNLIEISPNEKVALGILAIIIGILGMLFTRKLHERQRWYSGRLEKLYKKLDEEQGIKNKEGDGKVFSVSDVYSEHQIEHRGKYKALSKVRTNVLWMIINLSVVLLGIGIILQGKI